MAKDEAQLLAMGLRIKELRESRGYRQQWIADQVGVQLRTYQFWQQGKIPPSGQNLTNLAKLFGVTPKYILRGDTPDPFGSDHQIDRIEAKLDRLLRALEIDPRTDAELQAALEQGLSGAVAQDAAPGTAGGAGTRGHRRPARRRNP